MLWLLEGVSGEQKLSWIFLLNALASSQWGKPSEALHQYARDVPSAIVIELSKGDWFHLVEAKRDHDM